MGNRHSNPADWVKTVVCLGLTGALALACGETADKGADGSNSGGDTTSSGTSGGTATIPSSIESLEDLLAAMTAIVCRSECESGAAIEFLYREDCLDAYTLVYEWLGADMHRSLDAGNMSFDAAEAQRCVEAFAGSNCNMEIDSECDRVFVGHVPVGGACTQSDECVDGGYCNDTLTCPGLCEAALSAGAACNGEFGVCGSGLTCLAEGVCGALRANGEPCESNLDCDSYHCDDSGGAGVCAAPAPSFSKAAGEVCGASADCGEDLYCDMSASPPSCTPAAQLGEPCVRDSIEKSCVWEAYCGLEAGEEEGVCLERVPLGATCSASNQCAVGVCDDGVCVKRSGLGEPCVTDTRCLDVCEAGVCALSPQCPVE